MQQPNDHPRREQEGLFRTSVIVFSVVALTGSSVTVPFPWGRAVWWLGDEAAFVGTTVTGFAFIALVTMLATCRSFFTQRSAILIIVVVALSILHRFVSDRAMIGQRARPTVELRHAAHQWLSTHDLNSLRGFPPEIEQLTFGRTADICQQDPGGTFVFFPHFTHGIDNSEGLVWSSKGVEPPVNSFEVVTKIRRIDQHWFWINTT